MPTYSIQAFDPHSHLFKVKLEIENPIQPIQVLRLPNWIPGSYLIRDFAKNITQINAYDQAGEPLKLNVIDKSTWSVSSEQAIVVEYMVYAWDLSVRSAHFDETHAFFNGTSTFLEVVEQADIECTVNIIPNAFSLEQGWRVATGMPQVKVDDFGFGIYKAQDYTALIDYPVEMADFTEINFEANGIPHKMVLTGQFNLDAERLKQDIIKICETELNLFGTPAPIDSYVFQVMVTGSDYGGLEHRNSTALICSRNDLPYPGMVEANDNYLQFLELCSHEYFHTWNVKRIQPLVYQQSDLQTPVYTNQLWWFEGVTSYYDCLILLRAGIIEPAKYLELLAKQMTRVYRMPGRFSQTVAESSWLTWTKFYQQNENAPNAIISYYTKGSLIALALDLTIRQQTQNNYNLDHVLLHLWKHFGEKGIGLEDGQIEQLCSEVTGLDLTEFFDKYLFGTEDFDFETLFANFDIEFALQAPLSLDDAGGKKIDTSNSVASSKPLNTFLGANLAATPQGLKVTHVWNELAAAKAGIASGDIVIALDNLKIDNKAQVEQLLKQSQPGREVMCHYFRRDELRQTTISLQAPPTDRVAITLKTEAKKQHNWLNTYE